MIRMACALLLLMLCAADAQFIPVQPVPILHPGFKFNSSGNNIGVTKNNIGVNMPGYSYFMDAPIFADIMLQASGNFGPWDNPGNTAGVNLDSTGAPTVAAKTMYTATYPSGTYTLSYTGAAGLMTTNCGTLVGPTTVGTTQIYTVALTQNLSAGLLFCTLNVTGTPISNIHFMAPPEMTYGDFLIGWLMKTAPFSTFRFLDPLYGNGFNCNAAAISTICSDLPGGDNGTQNWSDRSLPGKAGGGTTQGFPYDYIIEMANITGKDVWINIPVFATDNFVCRLARLFRYGETGSGDNGSNCSTSAATSGPYSAVVAAGINSTSHIYVEYVNETWNSGFAQFNTVYCIANQGPQNSGTCPNGLSTSFSPILTAALAANLGWDTTAGNPYGRAQQVDGIMAKRNGDIFKTVFGSRSGQISAVYSVQASNPGGSLDGLTIVKNNYGAGSIDYMVVAPYISVANESADCSGAPVSTCINDLNASLAPGGITSGWIPLEMAQGNAVGIPVIAYEGGTNLTLGPSGFEPTIAADPSMYGVAKNNFTTLWTPIGTLFNWYQMCGNQMWGLLVLCPDHGSQRFDALLSLLLTPGDANYDGTIDANDCDIVLFNQGLASGAFWEDGDFNHDGAVGADDLALLNQYFPGHNCGSGQGQAVIPLNSLQTYYH